MALQAYLSSASASARDRRAGDDCSVCWPRLRLRRVSERTDVTFIVLVPCLLRAVLRRLYLADNNTSSLFYPLLILVAWFTPLRLAPMMK